MQAEPIPVRIEIVKKEKLTEEQTLHLRDRTVADEHRGDRGPCRDWEMESLTSFIFVVLLKETNMPIGLLYRGGPKDATSISWWIDQKFRGRGIGNEMVDLFANVLKKEGVASIAPIPSEPYRGRQNIASEKLAMRLRGHFCSTHLSSCSN